jgi:iron complex outermembrane recepter protein
MMQTVRYDNYFASLSAGRMQRCQEEGRMICTKRMVLGFACTALAAAVSAQQGGEPDSASQPDRAGVYRPANDTADQGARRQETSPTPEFWDSSEGTDDVEPSVAESQMPPGQAVGARSRSRLVEEIVVTAQKREESVQDVPISINAFSADLLDARGISDPTDLPRVTPGLTVGALAGFTITYLRGVGSDAFLMADPSVAMYIDGIYFPFAFGLAQNFGAVERIEVLKGPQGTLFGRNAVGGAISVVTRAPDFDVPEVSLQTSYGRFNDLQTRAHVNVPLTDALAISVSGLYNAAEPYRKGLVAGRPLPEEVSRGARVKLRWAPIDALDLTLGGFRLLQQGAGTQYAPNTDPSLLARAAGVQAQDSARGEVDTAAYFDVDNRVLYGQATLFTEGFDVKLLASDQYIQAAADTDFDGSPMPIASFGTSNQFADVQSAELQLLSNAGSWGADRVKWIGGLYYFRSTQGFDPVSLSVLGIDLADNRAFGLELPGAAFEALQRLVSPLGVGLPTGTISVVGLIGTESSAGFAQASVDITDWLAVTAGARYQVEERTILESSSAVTLTDGVVPLNDFERVSDTTRSFKPKLSFELRFAEGTLVFLSYQQAIKSSTFNVINISTPPDYVEPEELDAYEIGVKTRLFDGLVNLSAAAFHYRIKNLQVQFVSLLEGGAATFENAGNARVNGADFDMTAEMFPDLVSGLVLTAGGAFIDAKYTDYRDGSGFDEQTGLLTTDNDFSGNRVTRSPKFSGTVGLSRTIEVPGGALEIGADYYYNDGYFHLAQNGRYREQPHGLLGARVSYLYDRAGLRVTLFGSNLLDEDYNYSRFVNDFGQLDAKAPPRTYGLRLNWDV